MGVRANVHSQTTHCRGGWATRTRLPRVVTSLTLFFFLSLESVSSCKIYDQSTWDCNVWPFCNCGQPPSPPSPPSPPAQKDCRIQDVSFATVFVRTRLSRGVPLPRVALTAQRHHACCCVFREAISNPYLHGTIVLFGFPSWCVRLLTSRVFSIIRAGVNMGHANIPVLL